MISSEDAFNIIMDQTLALATQSVPLRESPGMILAEDIVADRDFPPFDRVTMDGIAIASTSWRSGVREYELQGIQAAGEPQTELKNSGSAIEIMTGAILPKNTDAVIKVEELTFTESNGVRKVRIETDQVLPNKNVHLKGSDRKKGDALIKKGTIIHSPEVGVLATVGKSLVSVMEKPRVAIISTGDELVGVEDVPLPHQIRRSNVLGIQAELDQVGFTSESFHLVDDKLELLAKVKEILVQFPILILSGGVSKGKFDYVPEILEQLGVQKIFHRIAQRPGKPFWFGKSDSNFVFALPGNPVSTFACFTKYISPWLLKIQNQEVTHKEAVLSEDFRFNPDLTYFLQVKVNQKDGVLYATPIEGHGSGDLANLVSADGFIELPRGKKDFLTGEKFPLLHYRPL